MRCSTPKWCMSWWFKAADYAATDSRIWISDMSSLYLTTDTDSSYCTSKDTAGEQLRLDSRGKLLAYKSYDTIQISTENITCRWSSRGWNPIWCMLEIPFRFIRPCHLEITEWGVVWYIYMYILLTIHLAADVSMLQVTLTEYRSTEES